MLKSIPGYSKSIRNSGDFLSYSLFPVIKWQGLLPLLQKTKEPLKVYFIFSYFSNTSFHIFAASTKEETNKAYFLSYSTF